jgi:hypothetical protein
MLLNEPPFFRAGRSERRTVTLIYSNGGDHATGHFRAVAKLAMQRTGGSPGA